MYVANMELNEINMSRAGSVASAESCESESDGGPSLAERERMLGNSSVEIEDVELSLAFVNIRERVAEKK